MKILRLTLKNLASLVDGELDYRIEPLASAGLMAITGATGSGKSTILDAMCLALFGQVPRLRSASKGQDGRVPDGFESDSLTMHDPRTLLRRGAAEGYAEVEFVGQDGRIYSANWQVRRARNRSNGKLQAVTRVLKDVENGQTLANQINECDTKIVSLIGLNFEQFTRAVMLAQSEFGAFLKASDVERAQLLERLLETDIYRRLSEFAFEKRRQYQDAYQKIETQMGGLMPLESEIRLALEASSLSLTQKKTDLESRKNYLSAVQDWYRHKTGLNTQSIDSSNTVQQMEADWLTLTPQIAQLEQLEQLNIIRPAITQQQVLAQRIHNFKIDVDQKNIDLTATQQQLLTVQTDHADAEIKWLYIQKIQTESRPKMMLAQSLEQDVSRLNDAQTRLLQQIESQKIQCQETQIALDQHRQQQADLSEQLELINAQLSQSESLSALDEQWSTHLERMREAEKINQKLVDLTENLPQLQRNALEAFTQFEQSRVLLEQHQKINATSIENNAQLLALKQQHAASRQADTDLNLLSQKYHDYLRTLFVVVELQAKQVGLVDREKQLEIQHIDTKNQVDAADMALTNLLKILNRQRLLRTENVEALRSQLQSEQPCPVCGSKEHPFSVAAHLLEAINQDDEQQEKFAREQLTAAQKKHHAIETEIKLLNQELQSILDQIQRYSRDEKAKKQALKQLAFADELRAQTQDLRTEWLAQKIIQTNQNERDLHKQINMLEQIISTETLLTQQVEKTRSQHAESQQRVNVMLNQHTECTERLAQAEQYFLPILTADLQHDWRVDMSAMIAHLQPIMTERLAQKSAQKNQLALLANIEHTQQLLRQTMTQKTSKQAELERDQKLIFSDLENKKIQLAKELEQASALLLVPVLNVLDWQMQLDAQVTDAQNTLNSAQVQRNELERQTQQLISQLEYLGQQLQRDQQEYAVVSATILDWHQTHPALSEDRLNALLAVSAIEQQQLKLQIEQTQHRRIEANARWLEHQKQVEQHQKNQPIFLIDHLPEAMLAESELITAIANHSEQFDLIQNEWLTTQLQLKQDNDCKTKSTTLQIELEHAKAQYHRIHQVVSPIASKDGKLFQKIAQGYFLDRLLEDTNQQLAQLTPRYQLIRAVDSLGLLVIDSDMADERRSVHSLSGGESFLVSLALALGLAAMASGRLRIESLFIDEGFGTLDPESLQVVMDALDRLQSQGRKVTVITHVQEMHERIPTQIKVQKMGNGQSKITVV